MDIIRRYRVLENDQIRATIKQYYGPILRICGILPCIDEGWIVITIIQAAAIGIGGIIYDYLLIVTTYHLRDELLLAGVEFHYSLLVTLALLMFFHVTYNREIICRLHLLMYKLYDYDDTDISEEEEKGLKLIVTRQRFYLIPLLVLIGIAGSFMVAVGPWIDSLVGAAETRTIVRGVYMKTPIPIHFPVEITTTLHFITIGCQLVLTAVLTPIVGGVVLLYIVMCQYLALEHRRLILSLKNLFKRSEIIYGRMYGTRKIDFTNISDRDKFERCITMGLKQNIHHHQRMREYFDTINKIVGIPLLLAFSMGSIIIALSLFTFIEKTNRIGLLLTGMLLMTGEVAIMYTICFFGEEILSLGEEVHETIYNIRWYSWNKENKKLLMLMLETTRHPFVISASLFFNCNMETFSSICNSAYSYFNMLTATSSARSSQST